LWVLVGGERNDDIDHCPRFVKKIDQEVRIDAWRDV
jgi:hypothetical protein